MTTHIGDKLRALRLQKGLTTSELANKVALSQSYISRFENNRAVPDVHLLEKILQALDCDLSTFFVADPDFHSDEFVLLINTIKKLTPEARRKLHAFLQVLIEQR